MVVPLALRVSERVQIQRTAKLPKRYTCTLHKFDASLVDCCYSYVIDVISRVTNTLTRLHCITVATDSLSVSCHDYRYYVYRMRCYLLADVSTY